MKKKLVDITACLLMASMLMTSCAQETSEEETEETEAEVTTSETTSETTAETTAETTPETSAAPAYSVMQAYDPSELPEAYVDVLNSYCASAFAGEARFIDTLASSDDGGIYLEPVYEYENLNYLNYHGYTLRDIDADGTPEMLIVSNELGDEVYCGFTVDESGNAVRFFVEDESFSYYVSDDGFILHYDSIYTERYVLRDASLVLVDRLVGDSGYEVYEPSIASSFTDTLSAESEDGVTYTLTEEQRSDWYQSCGDLFTQDNVCFFADYYALHPEIADMMPEDRTQFFVPSGNTTVLPGTSINVTLPDGMSFKPRDYEHVHDWVMAGGSLVLFADYDSSNPVRVQIYYKERACDDEASMFGMGSGVEWQRGWDGLEYEYTMTDGEITIGTSVFPYRMYDVAATDGEQCYAFFAIGDEDDCYYVFIETSTPEEMFEMLGMFSA